MNENRFFIRARGICGECVSGSFSVEARRHPQPLPPTPDAAAAKTIIDFEQLELNKTRIIGFQPMIGRSSIP
jgi:hypothetical protein